MTLLTTLKNCFSVCFQGLQVRKQSESNPLYDPTDDPKKFDFQANFKPDTPLPGTPGTSSWSLETPLGHCMGPKPDFHRFLVSFQRSGGRPWGPFWRPWGTCGRQMPPKKNPQARQSSEKVVSDGPLAKILKKVSFRIRFFNDFGMFFYAFVIAFQA